MVRFCNNTYIFFLIPSQCIAVSRAKKMAQTTACKIILNYNGLYYMYYPPWLELRSMQCIFSDHSYCYYHHTVLANKIVK